MRWLGLTAGIVAALLGIGLHWHVSLFSTTNVYAQAKPLPVAHRYLPMTAGRCQALFAGESESTVEALYGRSHSAGSASVTTSYDGSFDFYSIGHADRECDVYFDSHDQIKLVYLELMP